MTAAPKSIKSLMLIVAMIAFTVWGYMLWCRSAWFHELAIIHEGNHLRDVNNLFVMRKRAPKDRFGHPKDRFGHMSGEERSVIENLEAKVEYEGRAMDYYRRASNFPWMPLHMPTPHGQ